VALSYASGTYTGNGSARSLTPLSFQPKVVMIREISQTVGDDGGAMKFESMPSTDSYAIGANSAPVSPTAITSLDATGFSLGTSARVNANGVTYYYLALGGTDIYSSSYAGNTTDNRAITGVGFQPIFVGMHGSHNVHGISKYLSSGATTDSSQYFTSVANGSNQIQSLDSDGFTVGTANEVNLSPNTYYYFCIKSSGSVKNDTYTGNGSDSRNITGVGFDPTAVIVKSAGAIPAAFRTVGMAGDNCAQMESTGGANLIQSVITDGFQVGTDAKVNSNGVVYHYLAFTTAVSPNLPSVADSTTVGESAQISQADTINAAPRFIPELIIH
jgi:hypothetical protein